ncbi:hypothetical protein ACQKND_16290 [Viridibacillus arvi]|uniref:hypothetical protein n=1 Tax=Viridibacillus arvi TaxID=263475 RepID=UPI003D08B1F6
MTHSKFAKLALGTGILLSSTFALNLNHTKAADFEPASEEIAPRAAVLKASVTAKITYWGSGQSGKSSGYGVDMFMNAKDGATFAAKMNISPTATGIYAAAGFALGPAGGAITTVVTTAASINSQLNAKKILALTDKNKKVHIFTHAGTMKVTEWDGSYAQVKTSLGKSWEESYGGIKYGATVSDVQKWLLQ